MHVDIRPAALHVGSVCTGGYGLDLGFELAVPGARTAFMVEREAFACARLVAAMREGLVAPAPLWSDARTFGGRAWRGALDGLIGGIPCQPHSAAGKRLGRDDPRDLWGAFRRILVQSGAWFCLVENVRGMVTSGGAERVWRDLRRLGFEPECGLFSAAEVGAPHERCRFFVLAVHDGRFRQLADACGSGLAFRQQPDVARGTVWDEGATVAESGGGLAHPARGAGRLHPRQGRSGETAPDAGWPGRPVGNTFGRGHDGRSDDAERGPFVGTVVEGAGGKPLFPPGPGDLAGWRIVIEHAPQLEPAVRRMADGLASRVDRLRLLGNGVLPLEAAYAIRTLGARLATRGGPAASELVRMMGNERAA